MRTYANVARLAAAATAVTLLATAAPTSTPEPAPARVAFAWTAPSGTTHVVRLLASDDATTLVTDLADAGAVASTPVALGSSSDPSGPHVPMQWAANHLGLDAIHDAGITGSGVVVAVIDTGVDATHPDLAGRVLPGRDYIDPSGDGRTDPAGHGTHVAGIIAAGRGDDVGVLGVAPDARILPVRVLDGAGRGDTADVAAGVVWAADRGADVINLSLGAVEPDPVLDEAVRVVAARGTTVIVAAAGNDKLAGNPTIYPAAHPDTVAVGAHDLTGRAAAFSSTGPWLDLSAPGLAVLSDWPGGGVVPMSGTSQAAPHVAGAAALLISRGALPADVPARLAGASVDLGETGHDPVFGAGGIDLYATFGVARRDPAPAPDRGALDTPALWPRDQLWDRARQQLPSRPDDWAELPPQPAVAPPLDPDRTCRLPRHGVVRRAPDGSRC